MRNCAKRRGRRLFAAGLLREERAAGAAATEKMEKTIYVIFGLGNPGDKYARTRHNAGFEVLDLLEKKYGVRTRKKVLQPWAEAEWTDGKKKVVLCRPLTFMNRSGEAVRKVLARYRVPPEQAMVIYDDIDLPPGRVRVRKSGGPGTHNGMRDIVSETGTDAFPRIRVGTGDRPAGQDLAAWVLGRTGPEERERMEAAFAAAADCAEEWTENGIDAAMRLCAARMG